MQHYYMLCTVQDSANLYHKWFEVRETNDSGRTTTTTLKCDQFFEFKQIYQQNNDSVFFTTLSPARVYLYDKTRNVIDTLFKDSINYYTNLQIMYLSGQFFIVGDGIFLQSTDRSDLTKWQPVKWDFGTPSFYNVIFKGNVALADMSDSLRPENNYRISLTSAGLPSLVKSEVQKYYTNNFYSAPPYPIPGTNLIKANIYWNSTNDINSCIKGVYNVDGELISAKDKITITKINQYNGTMTWDCSGVSDGTYYIIFNINGTLQPIPVVVGK